MHFKEIISEWLDLALENDEAICDFVDALSKKTTNSLFECTKNETVLFIKSLELAEDKLCAEIHTIELKNEQEISTVYSIIKKKKHIASANDGIIDDELDVIEWCKYQQQKETDDISAMIMDNYLWC